MVRALVSLQEPALVAASLVLVQVEAAHPELLQRPSSHLYTVLCVLYIYLHIYVHF